MPMLEAPFGTRKHIVTGVMSRNLASGEGKRFGLPQFGARHGICVRFVGTPLAAFRERSAQFDWHHAMLGHLLKPEIEAMIRSGDFASLRSALEDLAPGELADALGDLPPESSAIVFRILPRGVAAQAFEYLAPDAQEALLKALGERETAEILNAMSPDDRTRLLEELPAEATKRLLSLLSKDEMEVAKLLLGYPEHSVGRRMLPHYVAVRDDWDVARVLSHARAVGRSSETLGMLYVVDERGRLLDDVRIGTVLMARDDTPISSLLDRTFVALVATDDQETAVAAFRRDRREALPVTDTEGVLVGIVTSDDIFEVAEAEATEDIQKLGGSEALDEPYLRIAMASMVKKRASWLVILFLGEMLTATAMGYFEGEIAKAVVLALFVPLIISSGGNSGSQASTLVIRAMALGEVRMRDWWRVMRREIASGLALGSILGTIGFVRIALWSAFTPIYGPHWLAVAVTVAFSLIGVVLWGTLSGSMLPFVLRRMGFDPATSSAPFVATLVDVTGLIIYFTVAALVLHGTLL